MAVQANLFGHVWSVYTFYCKELIYASMPKIANVSIYNDFELDNSSTSTVTGRVPRCTLRQDASAFSISLLMFAIAASDVNLDGKLSEANIDVFVCFTGLCDKDKRKMEAIWQRTNEGRFVDSSLCCGYTNLLGKCANSKLQLITIVTTCQASELSRVRTVKSSNCQKLGLQRVRAAKN